MISPWLKQVIEDIITIIVLLAMYGMLAVVCLIWFA